MVRRAGARQSGDSGLLTMMAGMVRDIGLLQVLLHGLTMPNLPVAERASLPAGELSVEDMQRAFLLRY